MVWKSWWVWFKLSIIMLISFIHLFIICLSSCKNNYFTILSLAIFKWIYCKLPHSEVQCLESSIYLFMIEMHKTLFLSSVNTWLHFLHDPHSLLWKQSYLSLNISKSYCLFMLLIFGSLTEIPKKITQEDHTASVSVGLSHGC